MEWLSLAHSKCSVHVSCVTVDGNPSNNQRQEVKQFQKWIKKRRDRRHRLRELLNVLKGS